MNNTIAINFLRFLGLVVVQGLVFKNVGNDWLQFPYLQIIVFPVFILLLPLRTPRPLVTLLGFGIGLVIDFFYNTLGLHASAAVFTAYIRHFILRLLEPRNGYNANYSPTAARMGIGWFLQYSSLLTILHLFFYFSVEAFTFVYIADILLKTVVSFAASMIFVMIYQLIFNPLD